MRYFLIVFTIAIQLMLVTVVVSCGTIPVPQHHVEVEVTHSDVKKNIKVDVIDDEVVSDVVVKTEQPLLQEKGDVQPEAVSSVIEVRSQPVVPIVTKPEPVVVKLAPGIKKYKLAQKKYNAGQYTDATAILEKLTNKYDSNVKYRDLLVLAYTKYATVLENKADLLEAQTILEKALSIQPHNRGLQHQLTELENRRNANQRYAEGIAAMQLSERDKAMDAFSQALKLKPDHELAKKQIVFMKTKFIDTYYKKAMIFYRKQELSAAITTWGRVLILDPDHEMAKLYRARAIELKEKLEKL